MPLSITVFPASFTPVYRQIVEKVRAAVVVGQLKEGEALPSIRALANQLWVNPNTVAHAYRELARERVVESRTTSGTFVAPRQVIDEEERQRLIRRTRSAFVAQALLLGMTPEEMTAEVQEGLKELVQATRKG